MEIKSHLTFITLCPPPAFAGPLIYAARFDVVDSRSDRSQDLLDDDTEIRSGCPCQMQPGIKLGFVDIATTS